MAPSPVRNQTSRNSTAGGGLTPGMIRLLLMALPVGVFLMALILPGYMFETDQKPTDIGLGPAAWPRAMLLALAIFSALWIAQDIWVLGRAGRTPLLRIPKEDGHYHFGKALVGLVMIVLYGWLLSVLGFAISTAVFIATWCVFGGLRKISVVLPVSVIGTIALLWLFMGLALMPLPRGVGIFGEFSIWLLRAVGIY